MVEGTILEIRGGRGGGVSLTAGGGESRVGKMVKVENMTARITEVKRIVDPFRRLGSIQ